MGRPLYVVTVRDRAGAAEAVARTPDACIAAALLARDAELRVALHAPARLFVHAAAVAWEGRVIAILGHSFAGKSTLAAALVRAGAPYLSDEYTVLDADGLVHPYPRPIHLRRGSAYPAGTMHAEAIGGSCATAPLPLGLVLATSFRAGARWRPSRMSPGHTALALLEHTVAARIRPAHAVRLIARALARGAVGLRGDRGEADATAARLLAWASRHCASLLAP